MTASLAPADATARLRTAQGLQAGGAGGGGLIDALLCALCTVLRLRPTLFFLYLQRKERTSEGGGHVSINTNSC